MKSTPKNHKSLPFLTQNNTSVLDTMGKQSTSESCPEFRSGFRIQTKAYENRSETRPVSATVHKRHFPNAYVDRLNQFYHSDSEDRMSSDKHFPPVSRIHGIDNDDRNYTTRTNVKPKSSVEKLPPFSKRYPSLNSINDPSAYKHDLDIPNNPRTSSFIKTPSHRVTITLTSPSGRTSTADDAIFYTTKSVKRQNNNNTTSHPVQHTPSIIHNPTNHTKNEVSDSQHNNTSKPRKESVSFPRPIPFTTPTIPPPVPILITPPTRRSMSTKQPVSYHGNKDRPESNASVSLSSSDTQSILEAVQNLGSRRSSTAAASGVKKSYHHQQRKKRLSRAALERDPKTLAVKMSLPCRAGCCYCVYASLLGPVKVYLTRSERPKKEPRLLGIKDGNGRPVLPVSRKEDITGLVYDAHNHSFHPPSRGQRPMFPTAATTGGRTLKSKVTKERGVVKRH